MNDDPSTVWWLGYWRAGEHLYWWTTAVSAVVGREHLRAAVRARVQASTWATAVDPADPADRPADKAADAGFVAAGSIAWSDLAAHVDAFAAAVPATAATEIKTRQATLNRRLRRVRELRSMAPAAFNEEEDTDLTVEQIDLALQAARQNRIAVRASLRQAWSGPLVDPGEDDPARALGPLLLPPLLREYLQAGTGRADLPSTTVVIAPAPELGHLPWEILALDDGTRLVEHALLRGGISPATIADLALPAAPDRPDAPGLLALDPAVERRRDDPLPVYSDGLPEAWTAPARARTTDVIVGRLPAGTTGPQGCSRERLSTLLREREWGRFVFHGHVTAGDVVAPTAASLVLGPDAAGPGPVISTPDGRALEQPNSTRHLSARVWLHDPARWPMPRRVAFIACQADDASYAEQTGLTLAAVNAGARIVISTRWPLPADASTTLPAGATPTTALALAVDNALQSPDPVAALRAWQLSELDAWTSARNAEERRVHAPLLWAAPVTYVLPDSVQTHALPPHDVDS